MQSFPYPIRSVGFFPGGNSQQLPEKPDRNYVYSVGHSGIFQIHDRR